VLATLKHGLLRWLPEGNEPKTMHTVDVLKELQRFSESWLVGYATGCHFIATGNVFKSIVSTL
jgi:hypothetical protein